MIYEEVRILDDWPTGGHLVYVLGRIYPGGPRGILHADGRTVVAVEEGALLPEPTARFPEGVLDRIVEAHGRTAPQPATERHLEDAIAVRDRLLGIVDRLNP